MVPDGGPEDLRLLVLPDSPVRGPCCCFSGPDASFVCSEAQVRV